MGKPSINVQFSMAMLNNQRVAPIVKESLSRPHKTPKTQIDRGPSGPYQEPLLGIGKDHRFHGDFLWLI